MCRISVWVCEPLRPNCRARIWGCEGMGGLWGVRAAETLLGMDHGKGCEGWAQAPMDLAARRVRSCQNQRTKV